MKKSLVYVIIMFSLFATVWSMVINGNIDELKKELQKTNIQQIKLDTEIQLVEAELAFLINHKNLNNLNNNHLNLISQPLISFENFIKINNFPSKLTTAQIYVPKEIN